MPEDLPAVESIKTTEKRLKHDDESDSPQTLT